jgi:large subunit ribosomal protein L18
MTTTLRAVPFRRKREGKTNYKKRLRLLLGKKPRLVVRPALQNIIAQIVGHGTVGDTILVGIHSSALEKYGWTVHKGNLPAAYLTGYLLGRRAAKKGFTEAVLDTGLHLPIKGSKIYACLKGVVDGGVKIPIGKGIMPSEERMSGKHIAAYAGSNKERFTDYQKKGVDPVTIESLFKKVKTAIEAAQ